MSERLSLHRVFCAMNRLNPTCRGKSRLASLAKRLGAMPPNGVYRLEAGVAMDLRMEEWSGRSIYFNAFEILCSRVVFGSLVPGSVFVDVGANQGYYSLGANSRVGEDGQVFAFEPNPTMLVRLRRNVDLSQAKRIKIFESALSDVPGECLLHVPPDPAMHGHASLKKQGWTGHLTATVPVCRLDDVLGDELARLDTIKIDAEGSELAILRGAEQVVTRFQPSILVEFNKETSGSFGYAPLEIPRLLLAFNPRYRFRHVDHHRVREMTLRELESQRIEHGNLWAYR